MIPYKIVLEPPRVRVKLLQTHADDPAEMFDAGHVKRDPYHGCVVYVPNAGAYLSIEHLEALLEIMLTDKTLGSKRDRRAYPPLDGKPKSARR